MSSEAGQVLAIVLYLATAALLVAAEVASNRRRARALAWAALPVGLAAIGALLLFVPRGAPWAPTADAGGGAGSTVTLAAGGSGGAAGRVPARGGGGSSLAGSRASAGEGGAGRAIGDGDDGTASQGSAGGALRRWVRGRPTPRPAPLDVVRDCPECPEMVIVPAGDGVIGASAGDPEASAAEHPRLIVRFWPGFAIGRTEVSAAQYAPFAVATGRKARACEGAGLAALAIEDAEVLPAVCVTARDATAYAAWLKARTGLPFRLPSATEWEYAARAGQSEPATVLGAGHPGRGVVRLAAASGVRAQPALRIDAAGPNSWGILGMTGSIAEHVADCWHDTLDLAPDGGRPFVRGPDCRWRMVKDGALHEPAHWRRPSSRRPLAADEASMAVGFRLARDLR